MDCDACVSSRKRNNKCDLSAKRGKQELLRTWMAVIPRAMERLQKFLPQFCAQHLLLSWIFLFGIVSSQHLPVSVTLIVACAPAPPPTEPVKPTMMPDPPPTPSASPEDVAQAPTIMPTPNPTTTPPPMITTKPPTSVETQAPPVTETPTPEPKEMDTSAPAPEVSTDAPETPEVTQVPVVVDSNVTSSIDEGNSSSSFGLQGNSVVVLTVALAGFAAVV